MRLPIVPGVLCVLALSLVVGGAKAESSTPAKLTFACEPANDLYQAVEAGADAGGRKPQRFDSAAEAVSAAPDGTGVLIPAAGYPNTRTTIDADTLAAARRKRLRLFIEFPESLPGHTFAEPRTTTWERVVVS